jgi:hypothetical protein
MSGKKLVELAGLVDAVRVDPILGSTILPPSRSET